MLEFLRRNPHSHDEDGTDLLLLVAGACVGLLILTLYAATLSYEVESLPELLTNIVPWQYPNVRPEPWEPWLYHLGAALVPLCAIGFWIAGKKIMSHMHEVGAFRTSIILALIASGAWITLLVAKSGQNIFSEWAPESTAPWQGFFFVNVSTVMALVVCDGLLWLRTRVSFPTGKWVTIIESIVVAAFVMLLAYHPHWNVPFQAIDPTDDHWFMIPARDILYGKHLLVDSESQYGFFIFYVLAAVFKAFGISVMSFKFFMMLLHGIYYALLYVLVRILFEKRSHALAAFVVILGFTVMRNQTRSEFYGEPSITRIRNFFDVPVILMFVLEQQKRQRRYFLGACLLSAIAFFYNVEMGMSIALMTAGWAIVPPFFEERNALGNMMKRILLRIGMLCGSVGVMGLLIALTMRGWTGSFPEWSRYFFFGNLYLAGFGAMPMPVVGDYWILLGIYLTSLLFAAYVWIRTGTFANAPLLATIAGYGLLVFHYYLNRSFIANLWVIALPAGLCFCLLVKEWVDAMDTRNQSGQLQKLRWPLFMIGGLITIMSAAAFFEGTSVTIARRFAPRTTAVIDQVFGDKMTVAVQAVRSLTTAEQGVAIISPRESVFLLEAGRKSAFHVPMLQTVFTIDDLQKVLQRFIDEDHPYLFVEREYTHCAMCDAVLASLPPVYTFDHSAGLLEVYKRNVQ